jgi:UPF0716 protein FxsA
MLRRWLTTLASLLVGGALVELVLLGLVVWWLGAAWTIGLLIAKSTLGYVLAQRIGRRGWRQFRTAVNSGRPPGREGTDAAVGFAAAMLVLLGGFLGAVLGLVALVPPVRRWGAGLAERVVERQLTAAAAGGVFGPQRVRFRRDARDAGKPTVDGEVVPEPTRPTDDGPPVIEGEIMPPR